MHILSYLFLIWNNYLQVEKKTGPAAVALADVAAAAKFVEDNEIAVLGFFADAEGNILLIIFLNFRFRYTGEYFSSALILELVDPQYDGRLFIEFPEKKNSHVVYKYCFECQNKNKNNYRTQHVVNLYISGNSMNNLLSYCGLTEARKRASEKDLPVSEKVSAFSFCLGRNHQPSI